MTAKLTKVEAGWYATEDGKLAVVAEGHGYINADGRAEGYGNDGWAVCYDPQGTLRDEHNAGETVAWVDTLREGKERVAAEALIRGV